jgi:hypothetical protein
MAKYLNPPTRLQGLTKSQIKAFLELTESGWPQELFGEGRDKILSEPVTSFDGLYHWSTYKDFFVYVTNLTETSDIISANSNLYKAYSFAPEKEGFIEPEEAENPANRPTKEQLEIGQELDKLKKAQVNAIDQKQKETIQEAIDQMQKLYEQKVNASLKTHEPQTAKKSEDTFTALRSAAEDTSTVTPLPTYYSNNTFNQPEVEDKTSKPADIYNAKTDSKKEVENIIKQLKTNIKERPLEQQLFGQQVAVAEPLPEPQTKIPSEETSTFQTIYTPPARPQIKPVEKVRIVPLGTLQTVDLTLKDKTTLHTLGIAALTDPLTTKKTIEHTMQEAVKNSPQEIKENLPEKFISTAAANMTEDVKQYGEFAKPEDIPSTIPIALSPVPMLQPISDPDNPKLKKISPNQALREKTANDVKTLILEFKASQRINRELANSVLGSENITELFYGSENLSQYQIEEKTNEQPEDSDTGIEIDLGEIRDRADQVRGVWEKVRSKTSTPTQIIENSPSPYAEYYTLTTAEVSSGVSSSVSGVLVSGASLTGLQLGALYSSAGSQYLLSSGLAGYLTAGGEGTLLGMSSAASNVIYMNPAFNMQLGNFSLGFVTGSSQTTGVFAAQASFGSNALRLLSVQTGGNITFTLGTGTLAQAAGQVGGNALAVAGTAAGATEGAVIGQVTVPIPIVGAIIGAVAGFAISLLPKIKNFISKNKELLVFAGAPLVIFGSLPLQLAGWTSLLAGGAASVANGFSIASPIMAFWRFLKRIGGLVIATISTGLIIGIILFLLLVALILVIINNSAYVVPQSESAAASANINPYIDVQKIAEPNGTLREPQTITYTITITAKKGPLTGITYSEDCKATKKGSSLPCPPLTPPAPPTSISPGTPYTFTYTVNYDFHYQDALISNNFTVTATEPSAGTVSATGTASVCFGNCPLDCFNFPDAYWPSEAQNLKGLLKGAASTLSGSYPNFAKKACAGGTINVCYNPSGVPGGGIFAFHNHGGTCDINFNLKLVPYGSEGALSLLTHEASHHIQDIKGGGSYMAKFTARVSIPEPFICYYGGLNQYESMAEGNALFVARPVIYANNGCLGNYQSQYPKHYEFARDVMFGP